MDKTKPVPRGKRITADALRFLIPRIHDQPYRHACEISLGSFFISATVDLLIVAPGRLHVYETKSNSDNVSRVKKQIVNYLGESHSLTFIAEDKICDRIDKAIIRAGHECYSPNEIGLVKAQLYGDEYRFEVVRPAKVIMPESEAFLLSAHVDEMKQHPLIKAHPKPKPTSKYRLLEYLAAHLSQEEVADYVAKLMWGRCDGERVPYPDRDLCAPPSKPSLYQRPLFDSEPAV
jgi:hypothetical protein